ncbi:alpha-1,2-mannosyltransferase ALG9-like [Clytia hemisphaerica]|uniref:Mannosyltransferase n=1 Tax=Clytia hemisphaerica TaxID=252671 RepID=A0A7M5VGQ9_9CNID
MEGPRPRFGRKVQNVKTKTDNDASVGIAESKCWCPRLSVVFNVLLSARITASFLSNISDCDETFNYWEPTHYLMYESGFQTWEYSPEYAIRSYAYLYLYTMPAKIIKDLFLANKITVFYYVRFILGILCAACETYFFNSLLNQFGKHVARMYFLFAIINTGMFISSTAFLPSSFAMYSCLLAFGGWFDRNNAVAIFGIAIGTLLGWPFFAILGLPIAFDIIFRQGNLWKFILWSGAIFLAIMIPMVSLDSHYYGKQVIAPLNIFLYNVFGQGGPDLYGVESWTFYFINGFLNFNVTFIMALLSLPICIFCDYITQKKIGPLNLPTWIVLSPIYIWGLVFFTRPHKEERFLFPIYPLVIFSAVFALSKIQELYHHLLSAKNKLQHYSDSSNWLAIFVFVVYTIFSFSRSSALYIGYHAPLDVYPELTNLVTPYDPETKPMFHSEKKINVCVGREWYRFPSSFFLPENWELHFVKSQFAGQLPQPYQQGADATKIIPRNMNDMNKEEFSRYINVEKCHLLIDLDLPTASEHEKNYSQIKNKWQIIYSKKFLDASRSHQLYRAFYVPFLSEKHCTFVDYNILRRINLTPKRKA